MASKITTNKLISAIIYLALGVLLCLSIINVDLIIKWVVGLSLIIGGVILMVMSLVRTSRLMSDDGAFGAIIVAFGIYCLVWGFSFTYIIAMVLIVMGGGFVIDGIVSLVKRKAFRTGSLVILILGAVSLTIGILLLCIEGFRQFAGLVLGIILIVYGVLALIDALRKK